VNAGTCISATTLHFICKEFIHIPFYTVLNLITTLKYYVNIIPQWGKRRWGESQVHGGMEVCEYMHSLMTVEINDYNLTMNVLSSPQLVDKEDSIQKKSVLLIATCCSHFQDLDLGTIP